MKREVVHITPPRELLQATPLPEINVSTYGDLLDEYIPSLIRAVSRCNADKQSVVEYIDKIDE